MTTPARKEQTVTKPAEALQHRAPIQGADRAGKPLDADANGRLDVLEEMDELVKCDNHPDRDGKNFTGGGSYSVNLCEECTPRWFKSD